MERALPRRRKQPKRNSSISTAPPGGAEVGRTRGWKVEAFIIDQIDGPLISWVDAPPDGMYLYV